MNLAAGLAAGSWNVLGRGRPKLRWIDAVEKDFAVPGVSWVSCSWGLYQGTATPGWGLGVELTTPTRKNSHR
ncbi:hypothetical protein CEXT_149541 [Caerostris extrusa]|uniref:Uncharacterized protein n=1 Tax=Caerostris extrusa TaxID=172846 RepID=A0AAV4XPX4_CAEEX|nr:hypothetical protein CEXT_149541 [Caerostris extrusa]